MRKIAGEWWNLNSMLPAPQPLSQFYLSAYLNQLRQDGYSIFLVQGALPPVTLDEAGASVDAPGRCFTPEQVRCMLICCTTESCRLPLRSMGSCAKLFKVTWTLTVPCSACYTKLWNKMLGACFPV